MVNRGVETVDSGPCSRWPTPNKLLAVTRHARKQTTNVKNRVGTPCCLLSGPGADLLRRVIFGLHFNRVTSWSHSGLLFRDWRVAAG